MTTSGEARSETQNEADQAEVRAVRHDFSLERYRYILQQIHTINENVYRFLAIYQALVTSLIGAALALFVGYRKWEVSPVVARDGVIGLLILATIVALFTATLIVVGALAWLDYRNEECDITDEIISPGFRMRPRPKNLLRWYETYILLFIFVSMAAVWIIALFFVVPRMD